MTKITANATTTREALPDAPDGQWLDTLLDNQNNFLDQVRAFAQNGLSIGDNTPWKFVTLNLQHGVEVEVKNPFDNPAMPVKIVSVASAVGLNLVNGKPDGSTYTIMQPQLGWRPSGKPSNSVILSAQYAPLLGSGEQIRSAVARASAVGLTNGISKQVTSISLTPGSWDISAGLGFTPPSTGTFCQGAISTAVVVTVDADSTVAGLLNIPNDTNIFVSQFRVDLTTTTTYLLVAQAGFTVGSCSAYGRISAVRAKIDPSTTARVTLLMQGA